MEPTATIVISLITVLLSVVSSIFVTGRTHSHELKMAREAQKEARRTKNYEYLAELMQRLLTASEQFQSYLGKPANYRNANEGRHEHSEIIGKAIAACLATGDELLWKIAEGEDGLTPNRVEQGENGSKEDYKNRNRKALHEAIKRMAILVKEAHA